jgi:membrane protein DedA with SNARE-associated domain
MLNFASAVLWTAVFAFTGYFLGGAAQRIVADHRYVPYAIGASAALLFAVFCALRMRHRSRSCSPDALR